MPARTFLHSTLSSPPVAGLRLTLLLVALATGSHLSAETPANAKPGVAYIGTEKCVVCHADQHQSYLATTHSIAVERTNVSKEPGGQSFQHPFSGFTYEVERREGQLRHRERMRGAEGQARQVTDVPITLSIGSGTHGKSYLYRDGPFWAQSPLSWYRETGKWAMSPGYEAPLHVSFRRNVGTGCLFCHVGNIDRKQGNPFDFDIVETTIGCERCHGPGQLHEEKHRLRDQNAAATNNAAVAEADDTIVNPANLSRSLSEAICQQCHLQTAAKSHRSGKDEWDFRPGLKLTDFRIDYQYRLGDDTMKIVGHVEQLHQSACYQQTETLSCVTCHNPHAPVTPAQRIDHHREICLSCHQDESCQKPRPERIELADNSCYQCHMPKADTEVVHTAFHHHRIGIHDDADVNAREVIAGLTPVLEIGSIGEQERDRCMALARVQVFRSEPGNPAFANYEMEATAELIRLKNQDIDDPEVNAVLSWLAQNQRQSQIAESLAKRVRSQEPDPTRHRIAATQVLAESAFRRGEKEQAVEYYRELNRYHRDARDTYFLGVCEHNAGNADAGIAALKRSLEIDPTQVAAHQALQAIYQSQGKLSEARFHGREATENQALIERLTRLAQQQLEQQQLEQPQLEQPQSKDTNR